MVDEDGETDFVPDQTFDSADPKAVNDARKRDGRKRKERLEMVSAIMEMAQGRAWIYETLVFCHMYQTSFSPDNPYSTAYREGERNVGLKLLAEIMEAAPDDYTKMLKEAKQNG